MRIQAMRRRTCLLYTSLTALAEVAVKNGYTKPVVDEGDELIIEEGRHPVIEQMLQLSLIHI